MGFKTDFNILIIKYNFTIETRKPEEGERNNNKKKKNTNNYNYYC